MTLPLPSAILAERFGVSRTALLEPGIAALAAERILEEDIQSLEQAVEAMDAAMQGADTFTEADLEFYLALARATQNHSFPS